MTFKESTFFAGVPAKTIVDVANRQPNKKCLFIKIKFSTPALPGSGYKGMFSARHVKAPPTFFFSVCKIIAFFDIYQIKI
jgi:hypothetical protein